VATDARALFINRHKVFVSRVCCIYQPSSCFNFVASACDCSLFTFGVDHGSVFSPLYRFSSYAATRTVVWAGLADMNVTSKYDPVCLL
jgi:hypothetical protein